MSVGLFEDGIGDQLSARYEETLGSALEMGIGTAGDKI